MHSSSLDKVIDGCHFFNTKVLVLKVPRRPFQNRIHSFKVSAFEAENIAYWTIPPPINPYYIFYEQVSSRRDNFKAKLVTPIDRRCSLRSPKLTVLFSSPICISILSSWTLMMSGAQHHLWSSSHLIKHLVNVVVGQATKINLFSSWAVV